jgi:hypothetical protein
MNILYDLNVQDISIDMKCIDMKCIDMKELEKYMFSSKNMMNYNKTVIESRDRPIKKHVEIEAKANEIDANANEIEAKANKIEAKANEIEVKTTPQVLIPQVLIPKEKTMDVNIIQKNDDSFTPVHKDKLFWCFYVLLNGFTDYEMNKNGYYAFEKAFKISSVEKLRGMKQAIKELKLKINEVEDELVHKECITLKGLQVLCMIYKVSVTYIYGRKYCEFLYGEDIKGIISQKGRNKHNIIEHSLLYEESIDLDMIKDTHWYIENVQKPLKAPTAYTIKELQDICNKLGIPLKVGPNGVGPNGVGPNGVGPNGVGPNGVGPNGVGPNTVVTGKSKTKKELYEDILSSL